MVDPTEVLGDWAEFTLTPPSEYLLNCLRSVAEATAGNGEPAYLPDTISQLITTIAGRGYGPLLFRTVHVMSAAAIQEVRLDQLLVTELPLTSRSARRLLFTEIAAASRFLGARDDILEFAEPASGNTVFKLHSRQVPLAAACLEFLVEALGFECLHNAFNELADDHGSARRKAVAKDLSARLYSFLGEHLPQVAERNMARLLADYLEAEIGAPRFVAEDIDDQLILDFWVEKSGDDTLSFRLFGTAARAWLSFRENLIHARSDAFDVHLSLTTTFEDEDLDRLSHLAISSAPDEDDGTTSPDLGQLVGDAPIPTSWLADLQRPPCSDIKFLTKTELAKLAVPALSGSTGRGLVLTCLRLAAFGPLQNRLVQTSRGGGVGQDDIEREIAALGDNSYAELLAEWRTLEITVEDVATTAFFRLWEAGSPVIFEYLAQYGDDSTRQEMAAIAANLQAQPTDEDADGEPASRLAERVLAHIDSLPSDSPTARIRQNMKRVAQSYRRQGLRSDDNATKTGTDDITSIEAATDRLHALACGGDRLMKLARHLAGLNRPDPALESQSADDLVVFTKQFSQLHETSA
ncbi:MAG: hypothetical protein VW989_06740 [Rhodobiaceae bacterium]|jgi:hypothetical protein